MRDSFLEFVLEQMEAAGRLEARFMFGGHGLYCDGVFFAILAGGRLYFKTDESSRSAYRERGAGPFQPRSGQVLKNYYEVPIEILEDRDALLAWARQAVDVASSDSRR